jgi:hypothetical protein
MLIAPHLLDAIIIIPILGERKREPECRTLQMCAGKLRSRCILYTYVMCRSALSLSLSLAKRRCKTPSKSHAAARLQKKYRSAFLIKYELVWKGFVFSVEIK